MGRLKHERQNITFSTEIMTTSAYVMSCLRILLFVDFFIKPFTEFVTAQTMSAFKNTTLYVRICMYRFCSFKVFTQMVPIIIVITYPHAFWTNDPKRPIFVLQIQKISDTDVAMYQYCKCKLALLKFCKKYIVISDPMCSMLSTVDIFKIKMMGRCHANLARRK